VKLKYKGITVQRQRAGGPILGYRARITIDGRRLWITKVVKTAEQAARIYDDYLWIEVGCRDIDQFNFPDRYLRLMLDELL